MSAGGNLEFYGMMIVLPGRTGCIELQNQYLCLFRGRYYAPEPRDSVDGNVAEFQNEDEAEYEAGCIY